MAASIIEKLLKMPRSTPISDVGMGVEKVDTGMYSVDSCLYLQTVSHDDFFKEVDEPLVVSVIWAINELAVRRAFFREITDFINNIVPPSEILLDGFLTYGEIVGNGLSKSEHASYARGGDFLHKVVSHKGHSYYFLSRKNDKEEKPFLIRKKLR